MKCGLTGLSDFGKLGRILFSFYFTFIRCFAMVFVKKQAIHKRIPKTPSFLWFFRKHCTTVATARKCFVRCSAGDGVEELVGGD
ncbi:hypothetical protein COI_0700 [Mannheimia haemolytica serotype A2 str. OVINE]|nr:hypothetical protein COI_0700 [Mannheimia haemolytica serotype A2 str. OVINE]